MSNYWTPKKATEPQRPPEPRLEFKEVTLPAGARFLGVNYISSCPASPARQATYHVSEKHLTLAIQENLKIAAKAAEDAICHFSGECAPDPALLDAIRAAITDSLADQQRP